MMAEPLPQPAPRDVHAWASPARRPRPGDEIAPEDEPRRDMAWYPQLISDGIAAAERRGGAVDHLTARRMSLMLLSQSNDPQLSRGLTRFASDGAITEDLRQPLRRYVRRPGHPHHPHSRTLLEYAVARGTNLGPLGTDFSARCDEADRADTARTRTPPDRAATATAKETEATQPGYAQRSRGPDYAILLWAADWYKERHPEARANLYDALRAGTLTDAPTIPYAAAWHGLEILTPKERAEIDAMEMDEDPWELYHWERDHEIE